MSETIPVVENNTPTQLGGKKKNGHKAECKCPICINMKYANRSKYSKNKNHKKHGGTKRRRGGSDDDEEVVDEMKEEEVIDEMNEDQTGGRNKKKKNGHKANCKCPICKNMRKSKRGGDDVEDQKGDIEEGFVKGTMSEEKKDDSLEKATEEDYEDLDNMEKGEVKTFTNENAYENVGGKRRTRKGRKNKSKRNRKHTRKHRKANRHNKRH